ncbi:MAG: hypothetical protein JO021_18740 [Alphaproteobacteria bacterium]|nr:hypothetical protein [Alphaproteobacteria bacterium]
MPTVRRDTVRLTTDFAKVKPYMDDVQRRVWADELPLNRFVGGKLF